MIQVLIIDDEKPIRDMLREMLASEDFEIREASDGRKGMDLIRDSACDLVITDLHMPGQEGLETIQQLHQEYPQVKIIAISGGSPKVSMDFLPVAKLLGANNVIYKPILQKDLLKTIETVMRAEEPS